MNDKDWQERSDAWVKPQDAERKEKEKQNKERFPDVT